MQYSIWDKFKNYTIQHKFFLVCFLSTLVLGLFLLTFKNSLSMLIGNNNEIQDIVKFLEYKDKDTRNGFSFLEIKKMVKGIDVSSWQGLIDWEKVSKSGIEFVIIRCGFRNLNDSTIMEDNKFRYNIENAIKYNIPVGVYFYSTAISNEEAIEEASFVLNLINDYKITYPVVYDFETFKMNRARRIKDKVINENALLFLEYLEAHGYEVMLYSNLNTLNKHWNLDMFSKYKIWLAHYIDKTTYDERFEMWQYADNGRINGIKGFVDLDEAYFAYEDEKVNE